MPQHRNIFLVGFMASGKTSVGAALSDMTGWELVDADDELVRRAGKSIARIFEESGEARSGKWNGPLSRTCAWVTTA